ncbi:MAG: DUF427 domain-containing protein [Acidimicrobiia bacterium]
MTSGHTITTERSAGRVRIIIGGETLADTSAAVLLHETGLPTRYYLPREDVRMDRLVATDLQTTCPFKGDAQYWSAKVGDRELTAVAWSYPEPIDGRRDIAGLICFFNERVDQLTVDGVAVEPVP